jgi:hypothetical protein
MRFVELHGDRGFRDDPAIIGGLAMFDEWEVLVLGHQKGRNTKENMHRNFGMARPEGYRKATRLMRLASRFAGRSSASSTPPARIPASAPRSVARPKRSRRRFR